MADISFYLYLEAAFRHKLFKDRGAVGFKWERYNLPYESAGSSKGIFEYARKVLPSFYSLHYPDTKEGHLEMAADFIKKLDQRQDPQTARYFNPDTAPREHLAVVEEAQTASQQANAQEASAASAAGSTRAPAGFPQAPAFVHNAAQARQPDIRLPVQPAEPTPDIKQAKFQIPKTPFPVKNTLRNLGSKAGVFFQRNIGKHLTAGRIATGVSATIGAVAGAGFGPLGALSGAGLGTLAPSWVKSGQATRFLGKAGNGAVNAWVSASNQISGGAARLTVSSGSKKLALGLVGGLFLFTLAGGIIGNLGGSTPTGQATPISAGVFGASDISNCKFTRAGNPQIIKSSILQGWISAAANTAGIPPQVLASVAMHESQDFTANADDNHDAIKANQYCNKGNQICIASNNKDVLHPKEGEDSPCTSAEVGNRARTAQAVGLMQNLDIHSPGKDLCSITESLNIAAVKLKTDGLTTQPTQDQVNTAINNYYNSCAYNSYNYCNEVWQDLQSCQPNTNLATQPMPPGLTGITSVAAQITELLYQTNPSSSSLEDRLFHNKSDEPGTYYWCTLIVIDAYNKAGFTGLTRDAHAGVLTMKSFFANTSGYQLLSSDTPVEQLRPGDVIFFEGSGQHTSLVKSVEVSQEGNGVIRTYESNNVVLEDRVFVQNHKATEAQTTKDKMSITGFGQIKNAQI